MVLKRNPAESSNIIQNVLSLQTPLGLLHDEMNSLTSSNNMNEITFTKDMKRASKSTQNIFQTKYEEVDAHDEVCVITSTNRQIFTTALENTSKLHRF